MLECHTFLLVVDVTSRFPVVRILNETTTKCTKCIKRQFTADFGLPKKVLTDNGPCFKSADFNEFHAKLGVATDKISSYNHASLGSAERMVQTVKQIMVKNRKKCMACNANIQSYHGPRGSEVPQ